MPQHANTPLHPHVLKYQGLMAFVHLSSVRVKRDIFWTEAGVKTHFGRRDSWSHFLGWKVREMYPETWQSPICLLLFCSKAIWKSGFPGCSWLTKMLKMLMAVCMNSNNFALDQEQNSLERGALLTTYEQCSCRPLQTALVHLASCPSLRDKIP